MFSVAICSVLNGKMCRQNWACLILKFLFLMWCFGLRKTQWIWNVYVLILEFRQICRVQNCRFEIGSCIKDYSSTVNANYFITSGLQWYQKLLYISIPIVMHALHLWLLIVTSLTPSQCPETCVSCTADIRSTLLLTNVKDGNNTNIKTVFFLEPCAGAAYLEISLSNRAECTLQLAVHLVQPT